MMKQILLSLTCAFLLAACAKDDGNRNAPDKGADPFANKPAVELNGRSTEDILQLKYKKAALTCSLWLQKNKKLDTTAAPANSFTWDLKQSLQTPRTLSLEGSLNDVHFAKAEFVFEEISVVDGLLRQDFEGVMYEILYTPVVKFSVRTQTQTKRSGGDVSSESSGTPTQIFEKATSPQLDSSLAAENGLAYRTFIRCDFDTEIYPAYQNQYKVIQ